MKRVNNVKLAAPSLRCEVENSVNELNIEVKNDNVQNGFRSPVRRSGVQLRRLSVDRVFIDLNINLD